MCQPPLPALLWLVCRGLLLSAETAWPSESPEVGAYEPGTPRLYCSVTTLGRTETRSFTHPFVHLSMNKLKSQQPSVTVHTRDPRIQRWRYEDWEFKGYIVSARPGLHETCFRIITTRNQKNNANIHVSHTWP